MRIDDHEAWQLSDKTQKRLWRRRTRSQTGKLMAERLHARSSAGHGLHCSLSTPQLQPRPQTCYDAQSVMYTDDLGGPGNMRTLTDIRNPLTDPIDDS